MSIKSLIIGLVAVLLAGGVVFVLVSGDQKEESTENKDSNSANVFNYNSEEKDTADEKATHSEPSVDNSDNVVVYFFWGDGCPHCAQEKPFLEDLEEKYPELEVKMFEVYYNKDNQELFQELAQAYGIQARGVPTTFIGDSDPIVGFGTKETTGKEIEDVIVRCIEDGCINPGEKRE